jgi:hypothetical protein
MVKKMQDETEWTEAAAIEECRLYANKMKQNQGESLLPYVSNKALKKEMKKRIAALKQVI